MTRSNTNCKLCSIGVGYGEGSQREVGKKYGVGKSSVARHRAHLGGFTQPQEGPAGLAGYDLSRMSIRGEDGSWYRYEKDTTAEHIPAEDIEEIFNRPVVLPRGAVSAHTQVLAVSDLQIGKGKQIGGGTRETLERARLSIEAFARRCEDTRPECILLVDGGDMIENMWNTPEQMSTNDLELTEQIRVARRLVAEAIYRVTGLAPSVVYMSVPSNHGRVRTGYKANAGTVDDDYGLDINHALEEVFSGRPGYEHVTFTRPLSGHETATISTSGTTIAAHHGHHSKGPLKHGEWWKGQDHGRLPGWDADILLMAHYHSFRVEHSGNGRWIISASSSDPGSDWFTAATGEAARQGMTTFEVSNGQWRNIGIV